MANLPSVRWGILSTHPTTHHGESQANSAGTGMISSWFVEDILLEREDAKVRHVVQTIGSSSIEKGEEFARKYCPNSMPKITTYDDLLVDPEVDIVYIGTPHAFHRKNCLDAIAAGKAVLCEKAFTLNAKEAQEVLHAARQKDVYMHEAMWLRHRPLVQTLQRLLHTDKAIGDIFRSFTDFHMDIDISALPSTSRYKDPALGAGSFLDIGLYSLTWAILALDAGSPGKSEKPDILAMQSFREGIEVTSSVLLRYPSTGRQGIVTSTTNINHGSGVFARIDGSKGYIEVEGPAPSMPLSFTVYTKSPEAKRDSDYVGKKFDFPAIGRGFMYEADNTALDFLAGRKESAVMPWSETVNVMEIMDEVRRQGGTRYAVD